jgi:glycosyl transferase family 2
MKISRVFATYNEFVTTRKAQNIMFEQGDQVDEIIYGDSASTDGVDTYCRALWEPDVFIKFKKNLGIAGSHNPLFAMASGDLIVLTGCNRVPPKGWPDIFRKHFDAFPNLAAACIFNHGANPTERIQGPTHTSNGCTIVEGVLMDVICFKRWVFREVGYYQTCFGLWGVEDLELSARIQRWCKQNNKIAGFIPNMRNEHMGFDPRKPFDPQSSTKEYYELKKSENEKYPERERKFQELARQNFPFFSPY